MKNKQTDTKLRSGVGLTRHLISGALCLAVISLICARASAQNLFAVDVASIDEFTPNGVQSIFASGLNNPRGLAFDRAGNLFVADAGSGAVYKFTPEGVRTTFASELVTATAFELDGARIAIALGNISIDRATRTEALTTFVAVELGS